MPPGMAQPTQKSSSRMRPLTVAYNCTRRRSAKEGKIRVAWMQLAQRGRKPHLFCRGADKVAEGECSEARAERDKVTASAELLETQREGCDVPRYCDESINEKMRSSS